MLFSTFLFPAMVCGTAFVINFVAIYYHASRAIPFTSMVRTSTPSMILLTIIPNGAHFGPIRVQYSHLTNKCVHLGATDK